MIYFMTKLRIRGFAGWGCPIVLLILSIGGCGETKISRCNSLISVANRTTQEIQTLPGQTLEPKDRFAKAAEVLDRASRDVGGLKIDDAMLQKLQTQLVEIYGRDRNNNQVLATSSNAKEIRQALQQIQQNDVSQKNLVKAANNYCQTPEKP
jgi:hypothetical protein